MLKLRNLHCSAEIFSWFLLIRHSRVCGIISVCVSLLAHFSIKNLIRKRIFDGTLLRKKKTEIPTRIERTVNVLAETKIVEFKQVVAMLRQKCVVIIRRCYTIFQPCMYLHVRVCPHNYPHPLYTSHPLPPSSQDLDFIRISVPLWWPSFLFLYILY